MSPFSVALFLSLCALASVQAQLTVFNLRASDLRSNLLGTADGYVKVSCGPADLGKTEVRRNNPTPWWSKEFQYFQAEQNHVLTLEVLDSDLLFDDQLGVCQTQIKSGTHHNECSLKKGGALYYSYTLVTAQQ